VLEPNTVVLYGQDVRIREKQNNPNPTTSDRINIPWHRIVVTRAFDWRDIMVAVDQSCQVKQLDIAGVAFTTEEVHARVG
jgi:hypothetical protein